jgi:hypothetical protein
VASRSYRRNVSSFDGRLHVDHVGRNSAQFGHVYVAACPPDSVRIVSTANEIDLAPKIFGAPWSHQPRCNWAAVEWRHKRSGVRSRGSKQGEVALPAREVDGWTRPSRACRCRYPHRSRRRRPFFGRMQLVSNDELNRRLSEDEFV